MKASFRSTRSLGKIVCALMLANLSVDAIELSASLVYKTFYPYAFDGDGSDLEGIPLALALLMLLIFLVSIIVLVTSAVFFLIWFFRSYRNLSAFNVQSLNHSPTSATVYWFVPLLCFYFPFRAMNEIYHGSDPDIDPEFTRFSDTSTAPLHGIWWSTWVIASIVGNITFRVSLQAESQKVVNIIEWIDIVMLPVWMICAWCAYEIVREITNRQEELGQLPENELPPEPPSFQ